jgi:VCBS repeat-containing protein
MKTDSQLHKDVVDELTWEPRVREQEIGVAAKEGVVTLTGFVESYAQKLAAEKAVKRVAGVRAYADELQVKLRADLARTDTDIAHAAANALDWDVDVPDTVTARVVNGWITLEGSTTWQYQKQAAERAVRYLTGVKGVANSVTVTPAPVSTYDVSRKIKEALHRTAEKEATQIRIEASEGKVTLNGTVHSWTERLEAEYAAWAAPGVTAVDDRLVVQS